MPFLIPKFRPDDKDQQPPYWVPREWKSAQCHLVCPNGHRAVLARGPEGHEVSDDGIVTPSCICPRDGCTFHEWVQLEGWTKEDQFVKAQQPPAP